MKLYKKGLWQTTSEEPTYMNKLVPSTTAGGRGRWCLHTILSLQQQNAHVCWEILSVFLMKRSILLSCWCGKQLKLQPAGCELSSSREEERSSFNLPLSKVCLPPL